MPDLREAAFALTEEQPVARRVFADPENLYVIALQTRDAPSEEQIASEMSSMREKLQQRERAITTGVWFSTRYKELEAAGKIQQFEIARTGR